MSYENDEQSLAKAFEELKTELEEEKKAREAAEAEVATLKEKNEKLAFGVRRAVSMLESEEENCLELEEQLSRLQKKIRNLEHMSSLSELFTLEERPEDKKENETIEKKSKRRSSKIDKGVEYWSLSSEDPGKKSRRRSSKTDDKKGPLSTSGSSHSVGSGEKTSKKSKRRSSSKNNTAQVVSDILNGVCEKDSKSKSSEFDLEGSTNKEEPNIAYATAAAFMSVALELL
jgi:hypothetical protein